MSATNRGADRAANDYYPTPAWAVHRFLDAVPLPTGHWLEPCVGDGAIVRAVDGWWRSAEGDAPPPTWTGIDVRPDANPRGPLRQFCVADYTFMGGALWRERVSEERFTVCLTNPPFAQALDFVQTALSHCEIVAMLLRLNWLGGESRADFLRTHKPAVWVLPNRPSFTEDGSTDATEYAWFAWGLGHHEIDVLPSTPKEVRCAA